jgi:hypothetical protein
VSNIFIQFENKIVENRCITNQIYARLQCYIDHKSPNEIELKSISTLRGDKDCCHIVLFFEGVSTMSLLGRIFTMFLHIIVG